MAITKPILTENEVWANSANPERDIVIPYDKLTPGWGYADKPSYQYFNWYWQNVTQFIIHTLQNGIPEWDNNTAYFSGYVKYGTNIYQSFNRNAGSIPSLEPRTWRPQEHLIGLKDVFTDNLADGNALMLYKGIWNSSEIQGIIDISLGDLIDVDVPNPYPNSILVANNTDGNPDTWVAMEAEDALKDNISLASTAVTNIENPTEDEILIYKLSKEYYPTGLGDYVDVYKWVNTYYQGSINWNKITDKPYEFNPVKASKEKYGGAKISVTDNAGFSILEITTEDDYVPPPNNLKCTNKQGSIFLEWTGTTEAQNYIVVKDGTRINPPLNYYETTFEDFPADNLPHTFYVITVNFNGKESYPSNYVVGTSKP